MRKVKVKYEFIFFLYAYLRQFDLSLDRSRWNLWNEFKAYHLSCISIYVVIDQLLQISHLKLETEHIIVSNIEYPSFFKQLKAVFQRNIRKDAFLSETEILYCCQLLLRCDELLKSDIPGFTIDAEKLRIDVAKYYSCLLEFKLTWRDQDRAMSVEHFMVNNVILTPRLDIKRVATDAFGYNNERFKELCLMRD